PAAGWGEKEGTFINSERRIGLTKKVARAPGHALSDFNIFKLVAHYWGCADLFSRWTSPEEVFHILKELSASRPCDFTGVCDYQHLDDCGGIQWPFTKNRDELNEDNAQENPKPLQERRLFEDGRFFTSDGKARFLFEKPRAQPEAPDEDYPFTLLTG